MTKARCMTCDKLMPGKPLYVELTPLEAIGVCKRCLVTIRSFCTMQADARGVYDEVKAAWAASHEQTPAPRKPAPKSTRKPRGQKKSLTTAAR